MKELLDLQDVRNNPTCHHIFHIFFFKANCKVWESDSMYFKCLGDELHQVHMKNIWTQWSAEHFCLF